MAEHGHGGGHGHEASHGHGGHEAGGERSALERVPLIGRFATMLKEIVSTDGLKKFLYKMNEDHVIPVALKTFDWIGELFGASGGGGGGHGHAHAHAH
jgi:hypothetical protein